MCAPFPMLTSNEMVVYTPGNADLSGASQAVVLEVTPPHSQLLPPPFPALINVSSLSFDVNVTNKIPGMVPLFMVDVLPQLPGTPFNVSSVGLSTSTSVMLSNVPSGAYRIVTAAVDGAGLVDPIGVPVAVTVGVWC